jgi:hypothetical protein
MILLWSSSGSSKRRRDEEREIKSEVSVESLLFFPLFVFFCFFVFLIFCQNIFVFCFFRERERIFVAFCVVPQKLVSLIRFSITKLLMMMMRMRMIE